MEKIKAIRKTSESEMTVVLDFPIKPDYRDRIKTPIPFLNHMIEHIAWRSGFDIAVECKTAQFMLTHVICEDLGIALGKAAAEYVRRTDGAVGFGDAIGIIDEAKAESAISFESRAYMCLDFHDVNCAKQVEGMDSEDLQAFLEGFAQGAACTLQTDVIRGENGHHIWEAVFRSFGSALGKALFQCEQRRGMTSGVAGKIDWTIE